MGWWSRGDGTADGVYLMERGGRELSKIGMNPQAHTKSHSRIKVFKI